MSGTDFRAWCETLAGDVQYLLDCIDDGRRGDSASLDQCGANLSNVLAALDAAPEGEPSDEELTLTYACAVAVAVDGKRGPFNREEAERAQLAGLRAVLSRWGRPATPPTPTAKELKELEGWLQEMLGSPSAAAAAQWETNIKYLAKFLRMADSAFLRQQLLQQENHRFREPERTILCDILANGTLLSDPDGTRYGIPATPLEGEVGELVAALRSTADGLESQAYPQTAALITRAATLLEQLSAQAPQPVAVSERLPEPHVKVLAHYFNGLGKGRTVCAIWVPAKSRSDDADFADRDFTEYDEEDDRFYWPEGWYEAIENWDDLGWVKVDEGEVVYWQPLPKWPAHAIPLPAPQGGEVK